MTLRSFGQPNAAVRQFDFWDTSYEWRRLFSELFGTFLLVTVGVGGGLVNARFAGSVPGPLRVVVPGPRPAALVPAAPARLRIVSRNGTTVPAQLVIPPGIPGQVRLRIQVPARARIQVPARARVTKALPAPPNW